MKIAHRPIGFVVVVLLAGSVAHAQVDVALRYDGGIGWEHFQGGGYSQRIRVVPAVGAELSWGAAKSPWRFLVGADAEYHSGAAPQNCPEVAFVGAPRFNCDPDVPNMMGSRILVGTRYAITQRLSVSAAGGAGVLFNHDPDNPRPWGARTWSMRSDMAFAMTDHVALGARMEQIDMVNLKGRFVRARPAGWFLQVR